MDRLLWFVFAGSRGGPTRARIVQALLERPRNPHQLAKLLGLDYKTVEYNLRVLTKHVLVRPPPGGVYGGLYEPSKNLLAGRAEFDRIVQALRPAESAPARPVGGPAESGKT